MADKRSDGAAVAEVYRKNRVTRAEWERILLRSKVEEARRIQAPAGREGRRCR